MGHLYWQLYLGYKRSSIVLKKDRKKEVSIVNLNRTLLSTTEAMQVAIDTNDEAAQETCAAAVLKLNEQCHAEETKFEHDMRVFSKRSQTFLFLAGDSGHPRALLEVGEIEMIKHFTGGAAVDELYNRAWTLLLSAQRSEMSDRHNAKVMRLIACAATSNVRKVEEPLGSVFFLAALQEIVESAKLGDAYSNYIVGRAYLKLDTMTKFGKTRLQEIFVGDVASAYKHLICSVEGGIEQAATALIELMKCTFRAGQAVQVQTSDGVKDGTVVTDEHVSWNSVCVRLEDGAVESYNTVETISLSNITCTAAMTRAVERAQDTHRLWMATETTLAGVDFLDDISATSMFEEETASKVESIPSKVKECDCKACREYRKKCSCCSCAEKRRHTKHQKVSKESDCDSSRLGTSSTWHKKQPLRFKVGDRVEAKMAWHRGGGKYAQDDGYSPGTIIKLWDEGRPYRINLDDGTQVHARRDRDECVRDKVAIEEVD